LRICSLSLHKEELTLKELWQYVELEKGYLSFRYGDKKEHRKATVTKRAMLLQVISNQLKNLAYPVDVWLRAKKIMEYIHCDLKYKLTIRAANFYIKNYRKIYANA